MRQIDRRTFLRGSAAAWLMLFGGCEGSRRSGADSPPPAEVDPDVDPLKLAPAPRPVLRLPGAAFGFPSPFAYVAGPGYRQMSLLYDTLVTQDASGAILPWLASSHERSDDGLVYTFVLRDGIRWHDGTPVTADDVAFTFDYYRRRTLGPLVVVQPHGIAKAVASGPGTVRLHLDRPDVTFLTSMAAGVPIAPRHVWEKVDDPAAAQDTEMLVGSGPYRLASYKGEGSPLLYEANDDYFLGRPFVRRIEITPVADELTALLAGEVDVAESDVTGTRPDALAPFRSNPAFGIVEQPGGFTFPLYWNLGKGGVLGDVRFRRACAMAIDRRDVVKRLTGGNGTPGNPGFLPPSNPFHVDVEQYPFDRRAANRLLDDAGYTRRGEGIRRDNKGKALSFELVFPNILTPLAQVLVEAVKAVGIELRPRGVELGPALYGKKLRGDYDMAIALYPGPSGPGPNADPDFLRPIFSAQAGSNLNRADGYRSEEFDDLAERQLAAFDRSDRERLVGRMQEILARDLPVLPLYYSTLFGVFRKEVFDQWYWAAGGFPVTTYNRHLFVTGLRTGTGVRPIA